MKLTELGRILKLSRTTLNNWARSGKLKTAKKIKENHLEIWVIDDQEALKFINLKQK